MQEVYSQRVRVSKPKAKIRITREKKAGNWEIMQAVGKHTNLDWYLNQTLIKNFFYKKIFL